MARKSSVSAKKVLLVILIVLVAFVLGFVGYAVFVPMLPADLLAEAWYTDLLTHANEIKTDLAADAPLYTAASVLVITAIVVFWFILRASQKNSRK